MPDFTVALGKLKLASPVLVASGTFGYAREYKSLVPLRKIGAIVTKTVTLKAQRGNPPPRIAETYQGMLNAIGLQNPGLEAFIREEIPALEKIGIPVIVSIAAETPAQFAQIARRLSKLKAVSAIELNISCPNLNKRSLIGQDARATYRVVKAVKKATRLPVITKLSPNVTDISEIAKAAQGGGSDILSLVNTFFGLALDVETRKPKLGNVTGGLSGPAIKPQALYMVREVFQATKMPIIGMGGIMNTQDALEFIICGASAVAIGTATFINPRVSIEIIKGIKKYLQENKIGSVKKLIGRLKR